MYATVTEWPSCIVKDQSFKLSSKFVQVDRLLTNPCWALDSSWFVLRCSNIRLLITRSIMLLTAHISEIGLQFVTHPATPFLKRGVTRGKVLSWEYRSPRKWNSRPPASVILCWVSWVENVLLIYYSSSDLLVCYPRESEGLCFYRRWFVCLSLCLFVTTITK